MKSSFKIFCLPLCAPNQLLRTTILNIEIGIQSMVLIHNALNRCLMNKACLKKDLLSKKILLSFGFMRWS